MDEVKVNDGKPVITAAQQKKLDILDDLLPEIDNPRRTDDSLHEALQTTASRLVLQEEEAINKALMEQRDNQS